MQAVHTLRTYGAATFAALSLLARPGDAQWRPSLSVNVGAAFPTDTLALETTFHVSCRTTRNGVCLDGTVGSDWGLGHTVVYDLLEADIGYSVAFGAERRTSLVLRLGGSSWLRSDKDGRIGWNVGIALRHVVRPHTAWRADFNWRRFRDFTWPSVTLGLEWSRPP